jgi:hypothetical protein
VYFNSPAGHQGPGAAIFILELVARMMKTSKSSARLLTILICVFASCGLPSFAQTVQPGNPTSPGLPPNYPIDTPQAKMPAPTVPSGWAVTEDGNGCQWAIPGGWYLVHHNVDTLREGGGSGKASLRGIGFTDDWDKYKKQKKQQLHATKILADSADRLWLQYSKQDGGLHYFVAIVGTDFMCTAHIDVPSKVELKDLTPVANQIATSVRPSAQ